MTDSVHLLTLGLVLATAVVLTLTVARLIRAPARAKRRVVEEPNSHHTAQAARDARTRHRWREIDLARIHEINREEVVRLLARVESARVEALRPKEREFLDHMATIAGAPPPDG